MGNNGKYILLFSTTCLKVILRHGIFEFSDLQKCAQALRQSACDDGGVSQSARNPPNPMLRSVALNARKDEKDAKKYLQWAERGWNCSSYQRHQIVLLKTGQLAKQVRCANAKYGFGRGADTGMTREQAMTLKAFTSDVLDDFFDT